MKASFHYPATWVAVAVAATAKAADPTAPATASAIATIFALAGVTATVGAGATATGGATQQTSGSTKSGGLGLLDIIWIVTGSGVGGVFLISIVIFCLSKAGVFSGARRSAAGRSTKPHPDDITLESRGVSRTTIYRYPMGAEARDFPSAPTERGAGVRASVHKSKPIDFSRRDKTRPANLEADARTEHCSSPVSPGVTDTTESTIFSTPLSSAAYVVSPAGAAPLVARMVMVSRHKEIDTPPPSPPAAPATMNAKVPWSQSSPQMEQGLGSEEKRVGSHLASPEALWLPADSPASNGDWVGVQRPVNP